MTTIETLKQEMREVLENNILRFWIDQMQDNENGGFYGRIDNQNVLHADADKGAILNARILWTFSAAYRVLRKPEYLDMATRAKDYIIEHFIDPEYGGVYWSLDYKGQPKDTKKQFYAIGFAIYGFSEYARARIRRSSSMPSALPSMAFRNMPEPQVTERPWNTPCSCMTVLRSMLSIGSITAISKPAHVSGARLLTCDSQNLMRTIRSHRTLTCISSNHIPTCSDASKSCMRQNHATMCLPLEQCFLLVSVCRQRR